eukprot:CAMPEP_0119508502 /NCGR_PEP_ID=MMETSP1344-20130328/28101_1 /TAXON_ID=236787 /ORGANISM="Florenciella parvula, Strain CCMP2471" /LENGTH=59 /DNA_ID=CAMNT_0007545251 /DNA_START=67 /DNA_END=242 /DNA_ORIENTATION=+
MAEGTAEEGTTAWTGFGDYMESHGTPMTGGGANVNFEDMLEAAMAAEAEASQQQGPSQG